ncbi:Rv3235 family protein [Nocardioides bruguierae]|uniref:Rv3235 family protein n=1 Tax=Nocardioides bruguierae TaxID=2945102 RepID=UPI00201FF18E|nr:Rv3235 family protein [Nocardioides bruguierae]MCL8024956.1 Rv3235 family protein [Nocardioides bruguierae]
MTAMPHALVQPHQTQRPTHQPSHPPVHEPSPAAPRGRRPAWKPEAGHVPGPLEAFLLASIARDEQRAETAAVQAARDARDSVIAVDQARWRAGLPSGPVQGTLALDLGHRPPAPAEGFERLPDDEPAPAPVVPLDRPARQGCERWARQVVQAALEIVGGTRPAAQLARWTAQDVQADLVRRAQLVGAQLDREHARGSTPRAQVVSTHAGYPVAGVLELAVHVRHGRRSRALAARFEQRRSLPTDRWLCTALDFA